MILRRSEFSVEMRKNKYATEIIEKMSYDSGPQ